MKVPAVFRNAAASSRTGDAVQCVLRIGRLAAAVESGISIPTLLIRIRC